MEDIYSHFQLEQRYPKTMSEFNSTYNIEFLQKYLGNFIFEGFEKFLKYCIGIIDTEVLESKKVGIEMKEPIETQFWRDHQLKS